MVIDCRGHITTAEDAGLSKILRMMDRAGVERLVISCLGRPERGWWEFPTAERLGESTADVSAAVRKYRDRFIGQV